jgi:hypothetical protein
MRIRVAVAGLAAGAVLAMGTVAPANADMRVTDFTGAVAVCNTYLGGDAWAGCIESAYDMCDWDGTYLLDANGVSCDWIVDRVPLQA